MKRIGPLLTLTVLLVATPAVALDSIVGKWKTAHVVYMAFTKLYQYNGNYYKKNEEYAQ